MHAGEALGIAGVDGNGQIELVETLAGLRAASAGAIRLDGKDITSARVADRIAAGLAYMPADRASTALVRRFSIAENLMLRDSARAPYARRGLLSASGRDAKARELMRAYDIRAPRPETPAARLSGGNQQKIVVARELDRRPAVLIAHQAAWGLDPGATRFVIDELLALRDAGAAILYISSELEEVLDVADRVAVIADGRFAGVVERGAVDLAPDRTLDVGTRGVSDAAPLSPGLAQRALRLGIGYGVLPRVLAAIALSMASAAALVALSGHDPLEAFAAIAEGAAGSPHQIGVALNRATPYLLAGSGVALCFRAGVINIGAEGQIALGGAGAAAVALVWPSSAAPLTTAAALIGASLCGAAWAGVATAIHLGRRVHEVLATLLLNLSWSGQFL